MRTFQNGLDDGGRVRNSRDAMDAGKPPRSLSLRDSRSRNPSTNTSDSMRKCDFIDLGALARFRAPVPERESETVNRGPR